MGKHYRCCVLQWFMEHLAVFKNNNSWDSHVTRTSWDQNMNTFTTQNEAVVVARCLSRNRDENGDGIITANEVKWYVPTSEQLMGMYLGAKSLPSPLVDSENINFIYSERGNYHYSTSDKKESGEKKAPLWVICMPTAVTLGEQEVHRTSDAYVTWELI